MMPRVIFASGIERPCNVPSPDPTLQREFALDVLKTLRKRGFTAYWAGGCVRDMLLGRMPKDYDVASDATPQLVREIFGRRRTIFTGAVFGVVNVLAPRHVANVEVATFRSDASYSDGRHPDSVTFSTPEVDAQRRDFTINGLFYDPIDEQVIDFVDGQRDLQRKIVRAIGDPVARITEDKLRMLRAVRFTATYDFTLDAETAAAIERMAGEVNVVSVERIAQELRQMLSGPRPKLSVELLQQTGLLKALLPEVQRLAELSQTSPWLRTLDMLGELTNASFCMGAAVLLHLVGYQENDPGEAEDNNNCAERSAELAVEISHRLRLSNSERDDIAWLIEHQDALREARSLPWSRLQPLAIDSRFADLVAFEQLAARTEGRSEAEADYGQELLTRSREALNPPPLLTGRDLIRHGVPRGRVFAKLLQSVRDAQLDAEIATQEEALELVDRLLIAEGHGEVEP